jgi:hypothetical protein
MRQVVNDGLKGRAAGPDARQDRAARLVQVLPDRSEQLLRRRVRHSRGPVIVTESAASNEPCLGSPTGW